MPESPEHVETEEDFGPERVVRQELRSLETDFHVIALLALSDWEEQRIVAPELFRTVACLQRPSWGHWNGLLMALGEARKRALTEGNAEQRQRILQAKLLNQILDRLGCVADRELVETLRPLAGLLRVNLGRKPRLGQLLALPISLRNEIAHFQPADRTWWEQAAEELRPLLAWWDREGLRPAAATPAMFRAPWFLPGSAAALNGFSDNSVIYVSPKGRPVEAAEMIRPLYDALLRLFGQEQAQEESLRRLLVRLAPAELKGVLLGDYLIRGPAVGRGGFADVFAGVQISTGRNVAVKLLHDELDDDAQARFQQEAVFLSQFNHPNIVRVIGRGEGPWFPPRDPVLAQGLAAEPWFQTLARARPVRSYLALEWVEGHTLEQIFQGGRQPLSDCRQLTHWFAQAADALVAMHGAGLIHRDVKPGNLMVADDNTIRLMDFGIARSQDEDCTIQTTPGRQLGTPAYLAPELLETHDAHIVASPSSDIYALCGSFYELYTGRRLFGHDRETEQAVNTRKMQAPYPDRPKVFAPGLSWEIDTVLLGGLQREPSDRYSSAAGLRRDLLHVLRDEPIEYRRPSLARRLRLWCRRSPASVGLVATTVLLMIGFLAASACYLHLERVKQANWDLAAQDLDAATQRLSHEDSEGAGQALQRAKGRLEAAGDRALQHRWDWLQDQLVFGAELERLRDESLLFIAGAAAPAVRSGGPDAPQAQSSYSNWQTLAEVPMGPRYAAAFRRREIRIGDQQPAEIAKRINGSPIRGKIVEALHHWFGNDSSQRDSLFALLNDVGPDDAWLQSLRRIIHDEQGADPPRPKPGDISARTLRCGLLMLQNPKEITRIGRKLNRASGVGHPPAFATTESGKFYTALFYQAREAYPADFFFNLFAAGAALTARPQRMDDALGFARVALALRPTSAAATYLNGYIFLSGRNSAKEAIVSLNKAIALDPNHVGAHTAMGLALERTGDLSGAVYSHQKAIQLAPDFTVVHSNLANTLRVKGDGLGAIAAARRAVELAPDCARGQNNLGMLLRDQGDLPGAISHLKKAIVLNPTDPIAHFNLGATLKQNKDIEGAILSYRRAIQIDPSFAVAYNNLGYALAGKGDFEGAIRVYEEAIMIDPRNALYYSNLGDALCANKDSSSGIRAIQRAINLAPEDAVYRNNLGAALQKKGDLSGAVAAFEKSIALDRTFVRARVNLGVALLNQGKANDAVAVLQNAVALDHTSAHAQYNLGCALLKQRDFGGAIGAFKISIQHDSGFAPAYSDLASALWKKGDLRGAQDAFKQALKIDPRFVPAYVNLGSLLLELNDVDGAIGACRQAVEINPNSYQAYNNLGAALQTHRDWDEALRAYEAATRIEPGDVQAYKNMANLFLTRGEGDRALAAWRKVVQLDPKDGTCQAALAGRLMARKDFDGAIEVLQHAVKALPADGLLHHYLGNALLQKGRLEEATRAYQKGVQIAPANEQLQFGLALCLLKNGDLQGAVTAYCQVVQLNPKNGDAWFTLGSSYLKLGRFEEALQAFRQAEKLGSIIPGYKFPQKPLQRAQQLADLDARFEAVRAGRTKPKDAAETVNLAILCSDYKEMYAAATKLFAEAFDASPQLADNVLNNYRFGAARCAVLASQRKGTDAKMLSDRELPRLRTQALGWLKADLSSWSKQASAGEDQRKQAQTALSLWQATSEFACVRDRAALNKLPETERAAWLDFWAAVGKVLGEAKGEGKPMAAKRG